MNPIKKPLLMTLALVICLIMLRLGVWQLDRADQKQVILDQVEARAVIPAVNLSSLLTAVSAGSADDFRFSRVEAIGLYAPDKTIYIDNKVLDGKIGYGVMTPFRLEDSTWWVMVDRGWIALGDSREELPVFATTASKLVLSGRLNNPPAQPPIWNDRYPVSQGKVWQYLPINDYAQRMQLKLLPLVLELAPDATNEAEPSLVRKWAQIDDRWVAKHQAYAFQWFAMAIALLLASLIMLLRSRR